MNKKFKVFVFPCGSEIGLELHNALKDSRFIELYGGSSVEDHGKFVYKRYIGNIPFVGDSDFINSINSVIVENKIDFIFPAHDSVVLKLAENEGELECTILTSTLNTCLVCRSKKKTYEYFKDLIRTPLVYQKDNSNIDFPIFMKPDIGQGSKGTFVANSYEEINFFLKKDPTLLLLEFLPGEEYTIDCFTNKDGKLLFASARERVRINNGISVNTKPVMNDKLYEMANIINNHLNFNGIWFFQVKRSKDKELVLMEIAPRVAGSMGIQRNRGVNLPLMSIFNALNESVEVMQNTFGIEMDRALVNRYKINIEYKDVYIDLDDTLINNDQISVPLISFIYQCLNKRINIHLLTSHAGDIQSILKNYKITSLFDSVYHIKKDADKATYITSKSAIFIDDSFRERLNVYKKLNIPTFDTSAVECLMDWRE